MANLKACIDCKDDKPLSDFHKDCHSKDGHRGRCKACQSKKSKDYYQKNKQAAKDRASEWNRKNKVRRSEINRKNSLMSNYGITVKDYNHMFKKQQGCCAICGTHQSELKKRLSVDHCHETGKVRSLLCSRCNHAIGLLDENIERLRSAINYLEGHHG